MTDRPVFVHAGLAKTGTTTLQQSVFSKTPAVAYLGKNLVPEPVMEVNRRLTRLPEGRFDVDAAREVYARHLHDLPGVAVFSDEDLSVWKFLDPRVMGARLGEVFPDHGLIYVTRRPADWVVSQYFFRLWTWRPDTFDGLGPWLAAHMARLDVGSDVAEIRFTETLRRLSEAGGASQVLVLPYELMARDTPEFLGRIEAFMGLDGELRALAGPADDKPMKVRIAPTIANYIRTASLVGPERSRFLSLAEGFAQRADAEGKAAYQALRADPDATDQAWIEWLKGNERAMRRALARGDAELAEMLDLFEADVIPPVVAERIEAITREETAAMRSDFGVDLATHGYPA